MEKRPFEILNMGKKPQILSDVSEGVTQYDDGVVIRVGNTILVVDEFGIKTNRDVGAFQTDLNGPIQSR